MTRRKKNAGEILISGLYKEDAVQMKKAENAIKDNNVERAASRSLVVKILQAKDLPAADRNKKSDPYCTIEYGGETHKTSVVKKNLNPLLGGRY